MCLCCDADGSSCVIVVHIREHGTAFGHTVRPGCVATGNCQHINSMVVGSVFQELQKILVACIYFPIPLEFSSFTGSFRSAHGLETGQQKHMGAEAPSSKNGEKNEDDDRRWTQSEDSDGH